MLKHNYFNSIPLRLYADWDEREEDSTDRQLWEDNWDDDNVEDDFSCQLRYIDTVLVSVDFQWLHGPR